jgi:hypothetical protein
MRARSVLVVVSVLLPAAVPAQRIPTRAGPTRPAPLPPQPAPIANALAYKRSRITVEAYPFVTRVQAPGFNGVTPAWTAYGAGSRMDYRVTRFVSATFDITSTAFGGPAYLQSAELGTRLHPERTESRFYPFADVRVGFASAYDRDPRSVIGDLTGGTGAAPNARYSYGFGAGGGIGTEFLLARSWFLTTEASLVRSRMTARAAEFDQFTTRNYGMTWYRYTLGLSYNPVHVISASKNDAR